MRYVSERNKRLGLLREWTARVSGESTCAAVLQWHLDALGARTEVGPRCPPEAAATVELTTSSGRRREVVVEWAGPITGVVDETTAQAICGVMHVHGRRDGAPRGLGVDYCSTAAAILASTGLLASLLDEDTPQAQVRTSVAEAALLTVSQYLAAVGGDDPEAVSLDPGGPPFTSADGITFEIETLEPGPWADFWVKLGAEAVATGKTWRAFQFRYATATAPIGSGLHGLAGQYCFADIVAAARATRVDICRLYSSADGVGALGFEADSAWPLPWHLRTGEPAEPRHDPGADRHLPLAGVAVLEAGRRVQAPLAAHVLSLLGARTTRVEPPGGDPLRGMPPTCGGLSARWLALNRHKDAVELDMKSTQDRQLLRQCADDVDVFVHNWAAGKAEQWGLGPRDMPPHLVYAYTSAFGDRQLPDAPMGTNFMMQARTGMAELVRPSDESPAPSLMTLLDVLGGLLGAEAVVAALAQRAQRRCGIEVDSSLLGAASALGVPLLSTGARRRAAGFRAPRRIRDGWVVSPDAPASGEPVEVTVDLLRLLDDPRFHGALTRDEHHCPAVRRPWRFS